MHYIIHVRDGKSIKFLQHKVSAKDQSYLKKNVIPKMILLADEEYLYGPAAILRTAAKWSHLLDGKDVYWCVDWKPGLLVVRFSPDGSMRWAAMRAPKDLEDFGKNPQYNLVYNAWHAQFDARRSDWKDASPAALELHQAAFNHANSLHKRVVEECRPLESYDTYFDRCEKSPIWQGTIAMD